MAKLVLKFDSTVLKEVPLGSGPVTIGRAPDNDIQIDNLVVSDHHARIYSQEGRLKIEDLDSANGISLNNYRVKRESLHSGDAIGIGKHTIVVDLEHDALGSYGTRKSAGPKAASPRLQETFVLGRGRHSDSGTPGHQEPPSDRARIPSLTVVSGRTNRKDFLLSGMLTVIGKSPMATVRLHGWFVPGAAAQISKRHEGYYLSRVGRRRVKVNGARVTDPVQLKEGDLIEVAGVSLKFVFRN